MTLRHFRVNLIGYIAAATLLLTGMSHAIAAENGKGFYLLGSNASGAAILPPPGTTLVSYDYFYTGKASGATASSILNNETGTRLDLEAKASVDADIFIKIPTALWTAPGKVLGGGFGLGLLVPIGWQDISADVDVFGTLNLPNGQTFTASDRFSLSDDTFNFGDPVLLAFLGWNRGNWHWKLTGMLNVPIGAYSASKAANMGFNRWAFDAHGLLTWLDPTSGLEASGIAGFTFNGENPDTDYKTGTEFHIEYALMKHFSKQFSTGLIGFHYDQVTGDSGAGATLGSFKGRTTAIGAAINYNTQIRSIPVATSFRWYHELDTTNRLEGDSLYFQTTIPLGVLRR
jgi:hypothetical protein